MQKKIIIYDFDGTLTPYSVTRFEILEKCGYKGGTDNPELVDSFKDKFMKENANFYDAVYRTFIEKVNCTSYKMTADSISMGAEDMEFNVGVDEFFEWIKDSNISNYILSSGVKTMIEKTKIAKYFDEIYATTFKFDEFGIARDIDCLIDDEAKSLYIEKIMKDNNRDDCRDIIYIGDGLTDYYAMEYVKNNGGTTIFVYQDENSEDVLKAKESDVVSFFFLADYSNDSDLSNYIKMWSVLNVQGRIIYEYCEKDYRK